MAGYPNNQGATSSTRASLTDGQDDELIETLKRLSQKHSLTKLSLLLRLIDRAFKAAGQVPPAGQEHREELELWADVLERVPELRLEGDYRTAEGRKRNGYRPSPLDVLAVYNQSQGDDLDDDGEERKLAGWVALADSDKNARGVSMTTCEYPGCESLSYHKYCMEHGDLRQYLSELKPKYSEAKK